MLWVIFEAGYQFTTVSKDRVFRCLLFFFFRSTWFFIEFRENLSTERSAAAKSCKKKSQGDFLLRSMKKPKSSHTGSSLDGNRIFIESIFIFCGLCVQYDTR